MQPVPYNSEITSQENEEARIRSVYAHRSLRSRRYSLFNTAQLIATHEIESGLLDLLRNNRRQELSSQTVLEIGCGCGYWLRRMVEWGATPENLTGIDLLPDRIDEAKRLSPPGLAFCCGSAAKTGLPDLSCDLIFQITVFTSILDLRLRHAVAAEMLRTLKPNGLIVWYDYHINNPRNADVRGIKKTEIQTLFPGCKLDLRSITLAPPLSRLIARYSPLITSMLARIPALRTHYLGTIQRSS